jgi:hypothetical protein
MTGPATGSAFRVRTCTGQALSNEDYCEVGPSLEPSVYFVNSTNPEPAYQRRNPDSSHQRTARGFRTA